MDLYAALGVQRGAPADEIRRAYRKLARKHHPDVNPGNKSAEEKFKEISAAYDVLSDPEKRKLYDEFGADALKGGFDADKARAYRDWQARRSAGGYAAKEGDGADFDLGDLGDLFGFGAAAPGARPPRRGRAPRELHATVDIDLAQALRGTELRLEIPVEHDCDRCHGSGDEPGTQPRTCADCRGAGRKQVVSGPMRLMTVCPSCGGEGKLHTPCTRCGGAGEVVRPTPITVRIPPGADEGSRLRVPGQDVVIETHIRPHPYFRREGLDLHVKLPVTLDEALAGAQIEVPTPDGAVKLKVPPRSQSGARLRLRGKGVKRGHEEGDLFVELDVRLPDEPDERLVQAAREARGAYTKPVREGIRL